MKNIISFDNSITMEQFAQAKKEMSIDYIIMNPSFFKDPSTLNSSSIPHEIADRIWLNLPVFCNPEYLKEHPESVSITSKGRPAQFLGWLEFVCPNDEEYFTGFLRQSLELVRRLNPKVISLDFIRTYLFWEKLGFDYETADHSKAAPYIEDGCYCPRCLKAFGQHINSEQPLTPEIIRSSRRDEWSRWKTELITRKAEKLIGALKEICPEAQYTMKLIPFKKDELDKAVLWAAGQDIDQLADLCDFVAPMTFYNILSKPLEWKKDIAAYFHSKTGKPVTDYSMAKDVYEFESPVTDQKFRNEMGLCENMKEKYDWYLGTTIFCYEIFKDLPSRIAIVKDSC